MTDDAKTRSDRINSEMLDSFDEELELEIDDDRLARLLNEASEHPEPGTLDRRVSFKELFRLQGELVKLQDWVLYKKLKGCRPVRGARLGRQGRGHQAHHPAPQPAGLPGRRATGSQ
jgi:hypothetical protein